MPKVIRHDGKDARFYEVDGVLYPSVTTILKAMDKPALVWWAANVERELVSNVAADLYEEWQQELVPPVVPRSMYLSTLAARLRPAKAHVKAKEAAGNIGTQCHKLIEWTLRTQMGAEAGEKPLVRDPPLSTVVG